MKLFKDLAEVTSYETKSKGAGRALLHHSYVVSKNHRIKYPERQGFKHIGTVRSTGHHVWHYHKDGYNEFHFHDPHVKGKVDIAIASKSKQHPNGTSTHHIDSLVARDGSALKADKAYHYLITKHGIHVETDTQTLGSQAVWRKLAKHRDVSIHGWHKGKPVNVRPGEEDHEDIYSAYGEPKEDRPKSLVASKKPLHERAPEFSQPIGWWRDDNDDHLTLYHGTHKQHAKSVLKHGINRPDPKTGMYSMTPDPHTAHGYAAMSGAGGESGFRSGQAKVVNTPHEDRIVIKTRIPRKWAEEHMDQDLRGNLGQTRSRMMSKSEYDRAKKQGMHDSEYYAASEVRFKKPIPPEFVVDILKKKG